MPDFNLSEYLQYLSSNPTLLCCEKCGIPMIDGKCNTKGHLTGKLMSIKESFKIINSQNANKEKP